jgi:hypothetical protein
MACLVSYDSGLCCVTLICFPCPSVVWQVCVAIVRLQRRLPDSASSFSSPPATLPLPSSPQPVMANLEDPPSAASAASLHSSDTLDPLWADMYTARYMNCPGVRCAEQYLWQDAELLAALAALPWATAPATTVSPATTAAQAVVDTPPFRLVCYSTLQPCHFSGDGDKEATSCTNLWLEFHQRVLTPHHVALVRVMFVGQMERNKKYLMVEHALMPRFVCLLPCGVSPKSQDLRCAYPYRTHWDPRHCPPHLQRKIRRALEGTELFHQVYACKTKGVKKRDR